MREDVLPPHFNRALLKIASSTDTEIPILVLPVGLRPEPSRAPPRFDLFIIFFILTTYENCIIFFKTKREQYGQGKIHDQRVQQTVPE